MNIQKIWEAPCKLSISFFYIDSVNINNLDGLLFPTPQIFGHLNTNAFQAFSKYT
jgi:hypothetical protein